MLELFYGLFPARWRAFARLMAIFVIAFATFILVNAAFPLFGVPPLPWIVALWLGSVLIVGFAVTRSCYALQSYGEKPLRSSVELSLLMAVLAATVLVTAAVTIDHYF